MTTTQLRILVGAIAVAVVVLVVIGTWHYSHDAGPPEADKPGATPPAGPAGTRPPATRAAPPSAAGPTTAAKALPPLPPAPAGEVSEAGRAKALTGLNQGLRLLAEKRLFEARAALADALNTGALPEKQGDTARAKLAELAQTTLFSSRLFPRDPCAFAYKLQGGDMLGPLERKLQLHVPHQLLMLINGIADAGKLRIGQTLKMLRGPFHAVVSKGRFTMDVYLQEPKTNRMIFVRRFRVGTGKDGATPVGRWRVCPGRKMAHAAWTPPLSSNLPPKKILWGQPGYPLGRKGYWISLEGIGDNPHTAEDGYGIHGTDDPDTVGNASSMGCIRLSNQDIDLVFAMLYEKWSTVTITK